MLSDRIKTTTVIAAALQALQNYRPMTVRQVYYQLVSAQVIPNRDTVYKKVSKSLVKARLDGDIPWTWIEDRLRQPRHVSQWSSPSAFAKNAEGWYRRDVWQTQPVYLETWLEKDALSAIFENVLDPYGVTLNVGRGYDGWSSIYHAARRFSAYESVKNTPVVVLYFGDFDPSGVDMTRSLTSRLKRLDCWVEMVRCSLTPDDITRYSLPPDPAKRSDSRTAGFIAEHGDVSVELDALPGRVLEDRLREEVEKRMDLPSLETCQRLELAERRRIKQVLESIQVEDEVEDGDVE